MNVALTPPHGELVFSGDVERSKLSRLGATGRAIFVRKPPDWRPISVADEPATGFNSLSYAIVKHGDLPLLRQVSWPTVERIGRTRHMPATRETG